MPMVRGWRRNPKILRADGWGQSNVEVFGSKGEVLRVKEVLNPQNREGLGGWISKGEVQRLRSKSHPHRGGLDGWISEGEVQRSRSSKRRTCATRRCGKILGCWILIEGIKAIGPFGPLDEERVALNHGSQPERYRPKGEM